MQTSRPAFSKFITTFDCRPVSAFTIRSGQAVPQLRRPLSDIERYRINGKIGETNTSFFTRLGVGSLISARIFTKANWFMVQKRASRYPLPRYIRSGFIVLKDIELAPIKPTYLS